MKGTILPSCVDVIDDEKSHDGNLHWTFTQDGEVDDNAHVDQAIKMIALDSSKQTNHVHNQKYS